MYPDCAISRRAAVEQCIGRGAIALLKWERFCTLKKQLQVGPTVSRKTSWVLTSSRAVIWVATVTRTRNLWRQRAAAMFSQTIHQFLAALPPLHPKDERFAWGFGFEFESCSQERWHDELDRQEARLKRYNRSGMDALDAKQPTPEPMRDAYRRFIETELNDVHTPSPSPSSEYLPCGPVRSVGQDHRRGTHNKCPHLSLVHKRNGSHGIQTGRKDDKIARGGVKKRTKRDSTRSLRNRSTHHMESRSSKGATVYT